MKLRTRQKIVIGLALVTGLLAACQTVPEKKKPVQPQTAEEFKTVLELTQSQFLRVETILNQFLSDQKEMKEKLSENKDAPGAVPEGVRDKLGRLAQLAAQDLKPYLTPEQLVLFVELTQGQKVKAGGRGGGRHSGSNGGMGMGHGGMGSSGF